MKLDDIDLMSRWRATYLQRVKQLKAVRDNEPDALYFKGTGISDVDILRAVQMEVLPLIQQKLDEAKTKLMMLGFDEFPE
jgi:hypothetical protein